MVRLYIGGASRTPAINTDLSSLPAMAKTLFRVRDTKQKKNTPNMSCEINQLNQVSIEFARKL